MSQAGIISAAAINNLNGGNPIIYQTSGTINFKNTGPTTLFTTGSENFVPIGYCMYMTSVVGYSSESGFNIGFTGPTYTDLVNGFPNIISSSGGFYNVLLSASLPSVPANTAIVLDITLGEGATTALGTITMYGFYI
jgi:hypothetical protein